MPAPKAGAQAGEGAGAAPEHDGVELCEREARLRQHLQGGRDQGGRGLRATRELAQRGVHAVLQPDRKLLGAGVEGEQGAAHGRPACAACAGAAGRAARTLSKMPPVTQARPASRFQCMGSPRNSTAPSADNPGTSAVIMVERTGP